MAFISSKNLLAPITNRVNLVTIILIVVIFSVLRLSGGKVSVTTAMPHRATANSDNLQDFKSLTRGTDDFVPFNKPSRTTQKDSTSKKHGSAFDDIMGSF